MAVALTQADLDAIRDAVIAAETTTSGEIFVAVAAESDSYRIVPVVWAAVIALVVPLPLIWLTPLSAALIYAIQLAVFIVAIGILSLPEVKALIVPERLKAEQTRALAVQQFLAHGLHRTETRTGVLIFASLAERRAEIVADAGIDGRVAEGTWERVVAGIVSHAKAGNLAPGLVKAVQDCGRELAIHFPPGRLNRDELPNEVVIL